MEHLSISFIKHFIETHAIIIYIIIFLGIIIEGEISVIFAGIFVYLGSINIFIALASVILGGATKSLLGYSIGFYLNEHHSHRPFVNKIEKKISSLLPKFNEKPFWSIFISRFFIFGIGWFTLIFSGYRNIALRTYIKAESYSLVLWSVGIMALGYFFGHAALSISRDIRHIVVLIFFFFVLFFILEKLVTFVFELFNIKQENGGVKESSI